MKKIEDAEKALFKAHHDRLERIADAHKVVGDALNELKSDQERRIVLAKALCEAFMWADHPKGTDYWQEVYKQLRLRTGPVGE